MLSMSGSLIAFGKVINNGYGVKTLFLTFQLLKIRDFKLYPMLQESVSQHNK